MDVTPSGSAPDLSSTRVGAVTGLWRYPVKSMAAESLAEAPISWAGVAGDRRWAFVRPRAQRNGFPWHTNRENPAMCQYVARHTEPDRPDKSPVEVTGPDGERFLLTDPALASRLGAGLRLMRLDRGLFDAMPLSLITSPTVAALCALAGVSAEERRFRPNLVISPVADLPYVEDDWVGATFQVGAAVVRVDRRNERCVVVNVDPSTGRPDSTLLKQIPRSRKACAGVYATCVQPGAVRVGDEITRIG